MMDKKENKGQILSISNSSNIHVSNISNQVGNDNPGDKKNESKPEQSLHNKLKSLALNYDLTEAFHLLLTEGQNISESLSKRTKILERRWLALKSDLEKNLITNEVYEQNHASVKKNLLQLIDNLQP
ncbi:MAG: hypothetical protein R8G66_21375 [Cytophagales bacterium]|nr:hypothetical protein [Cytophagales bacterium]